MCKLQTEGESTAQHSMRHTYLISFSMPVLDNEALIKKDIANLKANGDNFLVNASQHQTSVAMWILNTIGFIKEIHFNTRKKKIKLSLANHSSMIAKYFFVIFSMKLNVLHLMYLNDNANVR